MQEPSSVETARATRADVPSSSILSARRERVLARLRQGGADGVLVLFSAPVHLRNGDVEHDYRQDSDFYWLTGFEEPSSVAVLSAKDGALHLFVRPRDKAREIWDGPRAGEEGARALYGAAYAYPIGELAEVLPKLLADHEELVVSLGRHPRDDERIFAALARVRARAREGVVVPRAIVDPARILHEERLIKRSDELAAMQRAADVTHQAHLRLMREARPGQREYELETLLIDTFRRGGAERQAYPAIVGSGPNATILHYRSGPRVLEAGDFVLVDAGCEYGYYASDVTRTFPVGGVWRREQQALYEAVLAAQLEGLSMVRPGVTLEAIHERTVQVLTEGLVGLGLLEGPAHARIEDKSYKRFYMHRTSHWLGLDVHDVGRYFVDGQARALQPGMVFTIEPGLYVGVDDTQAPEAYRGLGVRIEDDVVVTEAGCLNLTAAIPKTVAEVTAAARG